MIKENNPYIKVFTNAVNMDRSKGEKIKIQIKGNRAGKKQDERTYANPESEQVCPSYTPQ